MHILYSQSRNYGFNKVELVTLYSIDNTPNLTKHYNNKSNILVPWVVLWMSQMVGLLLSIFDFLEKYLPWFLDYASCAYPLWDYVTIDINLGQ